MHLRKLVPLTELLAGTSRLAPAAARAQPTAGAATPGQRRTAATATRSPTAAPAPTATPGPTAAQGPTAAPGPDRTRAGTRHSGGQRRDRHLGRDANRRAADAASCRVTCGGDRDRHAGAAIYRVTCGERRDCHPGAVTCGGHRDRRSGAARGREAGLHPRLRGARCLDRYELAGAPGLGRKAAVLDEIKRAKKFFHGTVVAQAQRITLRDDRLEFTFTPAQRTLVRQAEQQREWIASLAAQVLGRTIAVAVTTTPTTGVGAADGLAPTGGANRSGTAEDAGGETVDPLRERVMKDSVIQAMLDVLPAEIDSVEKI